MGHFHILAIIGILLSLYAGYKGFKKIGEEKDLVFGGIELLLLVFMIMLFVITIFVPNFWQ